MWVAAAYCGLRRRKKRHGLSGVLLSCIECRAIYSSDYGGPTGLRSLQALDAKTKEFQAIDETKQPH